MRKTYKQGIKEYSKFLINITHIPQKEVEILLLDILDKNVIWLHLNYNKECLVEKQLKKLVDKRATNYPLEYITKKASFYGEVFNIEDGILIPRPETEILIEKAEKILKDIEKPKIIEIGTGSGIISVMLAILIDDIDIVAVDINKKALELAKFNAKKFNIEDKITFIESNLFNEIKTTIKFDMVISNPPYIANNYKLPKNVKYEPSNALFGGLVGDELLKNIIVNTKKRGIKYLLCEMGYNQRKSLDNFFKEIGVKEINFYKDLGKFDRGFIAQFQNL
jgi:release factor glutamine methyltransferase